LGWAAPPIGGLGCFRESTARRIYIRCEEGV
jgi:hypothetical protein